MYQVNPDFKPHIPVTGEQLDAIINSRVLDLTGLNTPIIIDSVELYFNNGMYYVISRSKDGHMGIAIGNSRLAFSYQLLLQLMIPYVIGKDARDIEAIMDGIYIHKSNYKLAGIPFYCCYAVLELSILDMLGRALGKPLGALFGPLYRDRINIYTASGNRGTTPEEELDILAGRVERLGCKTIKFKIGGRMSKNADSMEGRSENLIRLTRRYFGDAINIIADGNGSYDVAEAVRYGHILEENNFYFYEEPCPFDDIWSIRDTSRQLTIPIAFGEQETSLTRFKWLIQNDAAQIIQPDLLYNGGFIRNAKVARMANLAGKPATVHVSSEFPIVYTLHYCSMVENCGEYQEFKSGFEQANEVMGGIITLKDGTLTIPNKPGIGIDERSPLLRNPYRILA